MSISHEELKRLLHYDPETGTFTWQAATSPKMNHLLGKRVGLKGVQKHRLRWRALLGSGANRVVIGSYDCPAAAHFAYVVEADKRYGEFARAR
jgi:hypothetical protein